MVIVDRVALGEKEVQVSRKFGRTRIFQPLPSPITSVAMVSLLCANTNIFNV